MWLINYLITYQLVGDRCSLPECNQGCNSSEILGCKHPNEAGGIIILGDIKLPFSQKPPRPGHASDIEIFCQMFSRGYEIRSKTLTHYEKRAFDTFLEVWGDIGRCGYMFGVQVIIYGLKSIDLNIRGHVISFTICGLAVLYR